MIDEVVNSDDVPSIIVGASFVGPGAAALSVPKRRSGGRGSGSALSALKMNVMVNIVRVVIKTMKQTH